MKPLWKFAFVIPVFFFGWILSGAGSPAWSQSYGVVSSMDGNKLHVQISSGEIRFSEIDTGDLVSMEGFEPYLSPGDPMIPSRRFRFALPSEADLETISIEYKILNQEDLPGPYHLAPAPPLAVRVGDTEVYDWGPGKDIVDGHNMNVYGTDAYFQEAAVIPEPYGRMRQWQLAQFVFFPVQYNPVTGALRVIRRMEVIISYDSLTMAQGAGAFPSVDAHMKDLMQGVIDNYEEASLWYTVETRETTSSVYDYVILTVNAVVNGSGKLDEFEAFKEQQGFNVLTVTETARYDDLNNLTSMGSGWGGGTGNTAAENIRNWLKNNYASLGIAYALLIGNPTPSNGNVPMKMCWPRKGAGDGYEDSPTDYYYADLTGNWDLDGDGYYGEYNGDRGTGGIDVNVEVYVGRIPVYGTTYTDLDKILQKTIDYGLDSGDVGWRKKVLLPMEVSDDTTHGWPLGENIRTDYGIPNGWASYRIYEESYGLNPERTPVTISNVRTEWQNHYGLVTWWTHGSATYAADVFSSSDCMYLDDDYPSFTFQCSCLTGHPETTNNLGYELLKNGAIGNVVASRVSWYFIGDSAWEIAGGNSYMADRYSAKIINKTRAGKALYDMKMEGTYYTWGSWMNYTDFNLYGDPAIKIDDVEVVCPQPDAPGSITYPASDCDGAFTVSWSSVSGAAGYTLQRADNSSFTGAVTVYTGTQTSYGQSGLTVGTYYYRVRASNECGDSGWRAGTAAEVTSAPSAPSGITYPGQDCDGSFTVSWASVSGATGYTLQRANNSSFTGAVTVYSGALTSYGQSGLAEGTYYYRVRAENGCGNSGWLSGGAAIVQSCDDEFFVDTAYPPTCAGNSPCYATIEEAINEGEAIHMALIREGTYTEDVVCSQSKTVTVQSLDAEYVSPSDVHLNGTLTIGTGTLIFDRGRFVIGSPSY